MSIYYVQALSEGPAMWRGEGPRVPKLQRGAFTKLEKTAGQLVGVPQMFHLALKEEADIFLAKKGKKAGRLAFSQSHS